MKVEPFSRKKIIFINISKAQRKEKSDEKRKNLNFDFFSISCIKDRPNIFFKDVEQALRRAATDRSRHKYNGQIQYQKSYLRT